MKTTYRMNIIRNSIKGAAVLFCAALVMSGCQRESLVPDSDTRYDGIVKFAPSIGGIITGVKSSVTGAAPAATGTQSLTLRSEDGTYTLPMSLSVTSMEAGMATKATLINDSGSETGTVLPLGDFAGTINTFWVTAWDNATTPSRIIPDATAQGFSGNYVVGSAHNGWYQKVKYRDGASSSKYWMTVQPYTPAGGSETIADDEYIWKKIVPENGHAETKTFFAYANLPTSGATVTNTASTSQTLKLTAIPNTDILLGYYSGEGKTGTGDDARHTGTAGIHFYHPLTAIIFKVGNINGVKSIDNISISGVYSSGDATMDATTVGKAVADNKVEEAVTWSNCNGSTTVSQIISSGAPDAGKELGEAFIVIPQAFDAESSARIAVTITLDDGSSRILYSPLSSKEWLAGHVYRYSIGLAEGEVSLTTKGYFTPTSVSNVAVSNTGDISDYVRVVVIANWVDASGNIVETIDWKHSGIITGMASEEKWKEHTDGFYYYRSGVSPGSTTVPLFGSYTPAAAPAAGLSLDMRVIAQGIKFDEGAAIAKSEWGNDIPVTGTLE